MHPIFGRFVHLEVTIIFLPFFLRNLYQNSPITFLLQILVYKYAHLAWQMEVIDFYGFRCIFLKKKEICTDSSLISKI